MDKDKESESKQGEQWPKPPREGDPGQTGQPPKPQYPAPEKTGKPDIQPERPPGQTGR